MLKINKYQSQIVVTSGRRRREMWNKEKYFIFVLFFGGYTGVLYILWTFPYAWNISLKITHVLHLEEHLDQGLLGQD